jgi:hypothetical protein
MGGCESGAKWCGTSSGLRRSRSKPEPIADVRLARRARTFRQPRPARMLCRCGVRSWPALWRDAPIDSGTVTQAELLLYPSLESLRSRPFGGGRSEPQGGERSHVAQRLTAGRRRAPDGVSRAVLGCLDQSLSLRQLWDRVHQRQDLRRWRMRLRARPPPLRWPGSPWRQREDRGTLERQVLRANPADPQRSHVDLSLRPVWQRIADVGAAVTVRDHDHIPKSRAPRQCGVLGSAASDASTAG